MHSVRVTILQTKSEPAEIIMPLISISDRVLTKYFVCVRTICLILVIMKFRGFVSFLPPEILFSDLILTPVTGI